jgi:hypothetical protein
MMYALFFLIAEVLVAFVFAAIAQVFYKKLGLDFRSILKGVLERCFLVLALYYDYAQALTFFSAVKLATRLKHTEASTEQENNFNDFYLIGNFASVMLAIGYVQILKTNSLF